MSRRILPIIYNLKAYLDSLGTGITIVAGGITEQDQRELVVLIDNGGSVRPWFDVKKPAIQLVSRSFDRVKAGEWCSILAGEMRGGYGGVELPEVTEGGTTYPAVTAWEFNPQGDPGYIGTDANRLHMWSANFIVTIGG